MHSEPILLYSVRPTHDDLCLRRLIECFGLERRSVETSALSAELERAADHDLCLLASAKTLQEWRDHAPDRASALDSLRQKAAFVFVYGFAPGMSEIASGLSDGAIKDVCRLTRPNLCYKVSSSQPEITREFSGLSFGPVNNATDCAFVCSADFRDAVPLISIEDMPFWTFVQQGRCTTFLLACSAIADIQEQVNAVDAGAYFSRLLPAAMFLRWAFKARCWHGRHRFANFIIDDPPIKPSYGYLNYRDLISKMDAYNFATTIAFIPWNHRRTDNQVATLFRERPDRLSLCVHGCDHTGSEFSSTDLALLNSKTRLATLRMDNLRRQNGLAYSKTMVFPQGRFSTEALTALKSNNYLGAVNSSPLPDASKGSLTVADFLAPAITRHGGFPVFGRRYPGSLEQFAFDLFFGKPLLVVEHHGYLRDGGARLAEFITRLNSLEKLQWNSLHEIITRSYLEREISDQITACRLYANRTIVQNHTAHDRIFIVSKLETGKVPVQKVLIDGRPATFSVGADGLELTMPISAFSSVAVEIEYSNLLPRAEPEQGFASRSRVWTRRMLSEFRDNVLSRSDTLLAGAAALHRRLSERKARPRAGGTAACTQRTLEVAAQASAPAEKQFRVDEIAREILGTSSAAISKVLVIGSEGSPSFKRMQMRFDDPRQVPAIFTLLATALQSAGVDFNTTRNSSIPSAEIWLVSPLNDWSRTVLSCAAPIGEQPIPDTLSRPAARENIPRIEHQFPDSAAV
jgi:hypothetical protein